MGAFFSSVLGTYARGTLAKEELQRKQQDEERQNRIKMLEMIAPRIPDMNAGQVAAFTQAFNDALGVKGSRGKGGKGGGKGSGSGGAKDANGEPLNFHTVIHKLWEHARGHVQTPAGLQHPIPFGKMVPSATQVVGEKEAAVLKSQQDTIDAVKQDVTNVDPGYWKRHPEQLVKLDELARGIKLRQAALIPHVLGGPMSGADALKAWPGITLPSGGAVDPKSVYKVSNIQGKIVAVPAVMAMGGGSTQAGEYITTTGQRGIGYRNARNGIIVDATSGKPVTNIAPNGWSPMQAWPTMGSTMSPVPLTVNGVTHIVQVPTPHTSQKTPPNLRLPAVPARPNVTPAGSSPSPAESHAPPLRPQGRLGAAQRPSAAQKPTPSQNASQGPSPAQGGGNMAGLPTGSRDLGIRIPPQEYEKANMTVNELTPVIGKLQDLHDRIQQLYASGNFGFVEREKLKWAASHGTFTPQLAQAMGINANEAKIVSDMITLHEGVNNLRKALGGQGFRGPYAWDALQEQIGNLFTDPKVSLTAMDNSIQILQGQNDAAREAMGKSEYPNVKLPPGYRWTHYKGRIAITDGKGHYRFYQGER